jgi:hypothetical protein
LCVLERADGRKRSALKTNKTLSGKSLDRERWIQA